MLPKPPHIAQADPASAPPRFRWDEWNVVEAYQPADPDLQARLAALSHRANVAACAAMAEWIVWRFEKLSTDPVPHEFLEAAWASVVHTAYARYTEFRDDEWRGIVRGPQLVALNILIDLIWGQTDTTPGENAAWMSNLSERVLADPQPFRDWREGCLRRLEPLHPRVVPADALFSDEVDIGEWVAREAFDLSRPFAPDQTRTLIERFVHGLDFRRNRFLHSPDEMREFSDYRGDPYRITATDR